MEDQGLGSTGGSSESSVSSADLSSAVESISSEAPKLSGLDKLKAQKEYVEKNDAVPPVKGTPGQTTAKVPAASANVPVKTAADPNAPAGAAAPFTPDFKYKAGGKELEIPEKFRALITDKESEEEVKKLFGQAATLDEVKGTNATLKKNLTETGAALTQYQSGIQQLRTLAQKNDWDTWFQKLNIAPERIFQWVLDKVSYNQLPPEQRAQIDAQRNLQQRAEQAQEQVGQASHREMRLATEVKGMQLEQTLGKADVKSMNDAFDSRVGRPGAFRDAIIEHGKSVWALSNGKVDLTPEQAVADFVQKYGNPSAFAGQPTGQTAGTPSAQAQVTSPTTPPVKVIPNVAGRSASPVKQKPKNLEDLKRLRDNAIKEDNAQRSPSQGYLAG